MQVASVSMEKRLSHHSKLEDKDRMKTSSCTESLMSVDSSTARENKLASLLTFLRKEKDNFLAISYCRRFMEHTGGKN